MSLYSSVSCLVRRAKDDDLVKSKKIIEEEIERRLDNDNKTNFRKERR